MPEIKTRIDLSGLRETGAKLSKLEKALKSRDLLEAIREDLLRSHQDRFERQVAPDGTPWKPLNPVYAQSKQGQGILRASGRLSNLASAIQDKSIVIGTNVMYAAIHQFGGVIRPKPGHRALRFRLGGKWFTRSKVTIPARPFLGVSEEDKKGIRETIQDYIEECLRD